MPITNLTRFFTSSLVLWCIFYITSVQCIISDVPGVSWTMSGHSSIGTNYFLNDYSSVTVQSSAFTGGSSLTIVNVTNVMITNNNKFEGQTNVFSIRLVNVKNIQISTNIFNGTVSGVLRYGSNTSLEAPTTCLRHTREIEVRVDDPSRVNGGNWNISANLMGIENKYPSSLFMLNFVDDIEGTPYSPPGNSVLQSYTYEKNQIEYASPNVFGNLNVGVVAFNYTTLANVTLQNCTLNTFTNITVCVNTTSLVTTIIPVMVPRCSDRIGNTTNIHLAASYHNLDSIKTTGSIIIRENDLRFTSTHIPTPSYPSTRTELSHIYDSITHVRGLVSDTAGSEIVMGLHSCVYSTTPSKKCPIRVGIYYSQSQISVLKQWFGPIVFPIGFQYVAKHLALTTNVLPLNGYVHDIEIERDELDEFSGWSDCHNTYKMDRENSLLIDPTISDEFTLYTEGSCYNHQMYDDPEMAACCCPTETLLVDSNYNTTKALVFSTDNRINGILRITRRDTLGDIPAFLVKDEGEISPLYKTRYDSNRYTINPNTVYYQSSHPFLIVPNLNTAASLKELHFDGIRVGSHADGANRVLFSVSRYTGVPQQYDDNSMVLNVLSFTNCIVLPYYTSGVPSFVLGTHFMDFTLQDTGYTYSATSIRTLRFENTRFTNMDLLLNSVGGTYNISEEISMQNCTLNNGRNGFLWLRNSLTPKTVLFDKVNLTNFLHNVPMWSILQVSGDGTQNVTLRDFEIFSPPGTVASGGTQLKTLNMNNLKTLTLDPIVRTNPTGSVGLFYSNVSNIPCDAFGLLSLEVTNPTIVGTTFDFMCSAAPSSYPTVEIGCKDDTCYDNEALIQEFCVVDRSYTGSLLNLVYWHSIEEAIRRCNTLSPRRIYIVPDVYVEPAWTISPKYTSELLELLPYNGNYTSRIIVVGTGHTIYIPFGKTMGITMEGIDFVNPRGLLVYSPTVDDFTLSTTGSPINPYSVSMNRTRFVGYQPIIPFSILPSNTDYDGWTVVVETLLSMAGPIVPSIRAPNTNTHLQLRVNGSTILVDVDFYGSKFLGFGETKQPSGQFSTALTRVNGYNQWGRFMSLSNQWAVFRRQSKCVLCGGLTFSNSECLNVAEISWNSGSGAGRQYLEELVEVIKEPVSGNPYVSNRLPYGNPFYSVTGIPLGYVAALSLQGATGMNWTNFRIRNNIYRDLPIGVRLDGMSTQVLSLNDDTITINDAQKVPRQIQSQNDPISPKTSIRGTKWDVKVGSAIQDNAVTPSLSNVCNQMCPTPIASAVCRVSATYTTLDITRYNTLTNAISGCPFCTIYIMDPIFQENVTTNFAYTENRACTDLTIVSFHSGPFVGKQQFVQDCQPLDQIPSRIVFRNVNFQMGSTQSGPVVSIAPGLPTCILGDITFENCEFTRVGSLSAPPNVDAIQCVGCTVNKIALSTPMWNGVFGSILQVLSAPDTDVYLSNGKTNTPTGASAIVFDTIHGMSVTDSTIKCQNSTAIDNDGCITIYGSSMPLLNVIRNNVIETNSNPTSSDAFDAIVWYTLQPYTLAQLGILTANISGNTGKSTRYGIKMVVPGIDAEYPCLPGSESMLSALGLRNTIRSTISPAVIVDDSQIVQGLIDTYAINLNCLFFDSRLVGVVDTGTITLIYVLVGFSVAILIFFVVCNGWKCLCCIDGWKRPDKVLSRANKPKNV